MTYPLQSPFNKDDIGAVTYLAIIMLAEDVSLSALTFATSIDSFNVFTSSLACRSASLIKKEKDGKSLWIISFCFNQKYKKDYPMADFSLFLFLLFITESTIPS